MGEEIDEIFSLGQFLEIRRPSHTAFQKCGRSHCVVGRFKLSAKSGEELSEGEEKGERKEGRGRMG
jgi:hypothetical protein